MEQVPLRLFRSLDTFRSQPSAHRVKTMSVRAVWAAGGGWSLRPGLMPLPVPSCRVSCKDEVPDLRTVASSLLPICLEVEGKEIPAIHVNSDSMCYFWQLLHKISFSTSKFKSPGRQLRARLQDAKSCNSEKFTNV